MKAKYLAILSVCALSMLSACKKEISFPAEPAVSKITAYFSDSATKTFYEGETKFNWVEGDRIFLVVTNTGDGRADHYSHYASASGPVADFTGSSPAGEWEASGYALYPALTHGGSASAGLDLTLPQLYSVTSADNFMSVIPLIGVADKDNPYRYGFRTAAGVLKVQFSNVPSSATYVLLESTAAIRGTFPLNGMTAENGCLMSEVTNPGNDVYVSFPSPAQGSTITVYIPVPVGTIPAGATLSLLDANGTVLVKTQPTKADIPVERNKVLNITPKSPIAYEIPDVDLSNLLGEYGMIDYGAGPYSSNATPGDIVLEASDDASKGNVMMTRFAGVSGKQYGTFDGTYLVFYKDQIFGANPYDDAADKPYVAVDFFLNGTGVVNATFELVEKGKIKAVNADAFGLRSCTEEDWQSYGGGWPWVLCFNAITAQWKSLIQPDTYTKGQEIPLRQSMIYASNSISWDGQGVAGLVDDNPDTYWHSDYYYAVTGNDSVYGIYFDITLEQEIDAFQFRYQVRSGNAGARPTHVVYGVSSDGVSWTQAGEAANDDMSGAAAGAWVTLPAVTPGGTFKYVRFGITDSASTDDGSLTGDLNFEGYKKCTNLAELKLIWAE